METKGKNISLNRTKKLKGLLSDNEEKVIRYLFRYGPSYAGKMAVAVDMYATEITRILKKLKEKYPNLLCSEKKEIPLAERKNTAKRGMYYWIFDKKLAQKILDESIFLKK